jgi:hypothetical protein
MPATSTPLTTAKRGPRLAALAPRPSTARSRVSNGTDGCVLPGIDQRSAIARRFRDVAAAVCADLGGADRCSEARLHLIRRFAAQVCLAEVMEARMANGEDIDVGAHCQTSSTLVRLATRIGLKRNAKDITPTLSEILLQAEEETEDRDEREEDHAP